MSHAADFRNSRNIEHSANTKDIIYMYVRTLLMGYKIAECCKRQQLTWIKLLHWPNMLYYSGILISQTFDFLNLPITQTKSCSPSLSWTQQFYHKFLKLSDFSKQLPFSLEVWEIRILLYMKQYLLINLSLTSHSVFFHEETSKYRYMYLLINCMCMFGK